MAGIERLTDHEKAALRDMVRRADKSLDVIQFSQMLVDAARQFRKNPFRFVEVEMRRLDSGLYLLATPMTSAMKRKFITSMPYSGDQEYSFGLTLLAARENRWQRELRALGVTSTENLINLDSAGFMGPKPGTRLSRSLRFRQN